VSDATPTRSLAPLATTARLSLGSIAPAQSTDAHLRFQLDHALARDAVHTPLDLALLQRGLTARGLQPIPLHSGVDALFAPNAPADELRRTYLRRPDLGRTLHPDSVLYLQQLAGAPLGVPDERSLLGGVTRLDSETWAESAQPPNILFLLADGLSAQALERHALPLLDATLPLLPTGVPGGRSWPAGVATPYSLLPILTNARVAIADHIGHILGAQITVLLIGERPGLSSPDSLGVYITWDPRPGRTDAERNCISNIRGDAGLSYAEAAHRIVHYIREAQRLQTTGIALKDPAQPQTSAQSDLPRPQNPEKLLPK
jgi:ethanolamine ammonia-lyase small subunit